MTGNSLSVIANRISFLYNLSGPSMTVDTACSSASTAFHLACLALRAGECETAVVIGVGALLHVSPFVGFSQARMISPTGTSRPFDARANGFVRGEGCGAMILRTGSSPVTKGVNYATVVGDGANEDGRTKSMTMPCGNAQLDVMDSVHKRFGVDPAQVMYFEAHGTGTKVGDPIEASSISKMYNSDGARQLAVGSVKGNIGHLETASGIAGLIKSCLCLRLENIVPTAGFAQLNPELQQYSQNIYIADSVEAFPMPSSDGLPIIGVNSYGFGGSNAFVLLQQAATEPAAQPDADPSGESLVCCVPMTSHFKDGLDATCAALKAGLTAGTPIKELLSRYSVNCGGLHSHRACIVGTSAEIEEALSTPLAEKTGSAKTVTSPKPVPANKPRVGFIFGGQGSQWDNMISSIDQGSPLFSRCLDHVISVYESALGQSAKDFREPLPLEQQANLSVALPAIMIWTFAAIDFLRMVGVQPSVVMGHSTGEMAAAYAAGHLSLKQVILLMALRKRNQGKMPAGAMAAVKLPRASAMELIQTCNDDESVGKLDIAAYNSEDSLTLAGDPDAIDMAVKICKGKDVPATRLPIQRAFHSFHVEHVRETLVQELDTILADPDYLKEAPDMSPENLIPFVSSANGHARLVEPGEAGTTDFWFRNIRNAVQFAGAFDIVKDMCDIVVELSPHSVLRNYIKAMSPSTAYVFPQRRNFDSAPLVLQCLAQLFVAGVEVCWRSLDIETSPELSATTCAPTVVWEHKTALRSAVWKKDLKAKAATKPLAYDDDLPPVRSSMAVPLPSNLWDNHLFDGKPVLPGAKLLWDAAAGQGAVEDVEWLKFAKGVDEYTVQTQADTGFTSLMSTKGEKLMSCVVCSADETPKKDAAGEQTLEPDESYESVDPSLVYAALAKYTPLRLDPPFQSIRTYYMKDEASIAEISLDASVPKADAPALLIDSVFQTLAFSLGIDTYSPIPHSLSKLVLHRPEALISSVRFSARLTTRRLARSFAVGDISLFRDGEVVLECSGLRLEMQSTTPSEAILMGVGVPSAGMSHKDDATTQVELRAAAEWCSSSDLVQQLAASTVTSEPAEGLGAAAPAPSTTVRLGVTCPSRDQISELAQLLNADDGLVVITEGGVDAHFIGLCRTARNELARSKLFVFVVRLEKRSDPAVAERLLDTIKSACAAIEQGDVVDYEYYWQDGAFQSERLTVLDRTPQQPAASAASEAVESRVQVNTPGLLSSLKFHQILLDREPLQADQVRVKVEAVSLHFKDVMLAMGMLKGFSSTLGNELVGVVESVGASVPGSIGVGDRVIVMSMEASTSDDASKGMEDTLLATMVKVNHSKVFAVKGSDYTAPQIAGFTGVMATAWYALVTKAGLRKNDVVLVHSALGGIGQSAIQIAKLKGATVIASAGTAEKRDRLLSSEFGVAHVLDSRDPSSFTREIMSFTNGRGVDVVLNSLAGAGQTESLKCVAAGGRFVEIGKVDILDNKALSLALLKNNVSFLSVHLDYLEKTHPDIVSELAEEVLTLLDTKQLQPIETKAFPWPEAPDAIKYMSRGKHTGKVVVEIADDHRKKPVADLCAPHTLFHPQKNYIFVGGTAGLGLAMALWALDRGASHIVLASASGKVKGREQLFVDQAMRQHPGATIRVVPLDVRDAKSVEALVVDSTDLPVGGVFHSAILYNDVPMGSLSSDTIPELLKSADVKAAGSQNLHAACESCKSLDFFVMFTSLASLHGNTFQPMYVESNVQMYELAKHRRQQGLPGICVDFPITGGAGRLSEVRNTKELELNIRKGFPLVSVAELPPLWEDILWNQHAFPSHVVIDAPQWESYLRLDHNTAVWRDLCPGAVEKAAAGAVATSAGGEQGAVKARGPVNRGQVLQDVKQQIAYVLGAEPDEVEDDVNIIELGVDSLASIELINHIKTKYGVEVSQSDVLEGISAAALVELVIKMTGETDSLMPAVDTAVVEEKAEKQHGQSGAAQTQPLSLAVKPEPQLAATRTSGAVSLEQTSNGLVVDLLVDSLNADVLEEILAAVERTKDLPLVFQSSSGNFCTGMDLDSGAVFGDDVMSRGLEAFADLHKALDTHPMPIVSICSGATRGGGMLFPSLSTVVIANEGATFGFPEIRRGGLPGVVSVAAQRRLGQAQCERLMLLGDAFDAPEALRLGFVDKVCADPSGEVRRVLGRWASIDTPLVKAGRSSLPASTVDEALVTMGSLDVRGKENDRTETDLVLLQVDTDGVAHLALNDPTRCNAMDFALAEQLNAKIDAMEAGEYGEVRAVIFYGKGEHWCVGVNPYSFIKNTKRLPVITAASVTKFIYTAFVRVRQIKAPVVCVAHGKIVGGGFAAMLNSDYRILVDDDTTVLNYGNMPRGVCPGVMLSTNLPRMVGETNAFSAYLQDAFFTPQEVVSMGLVNECQPSRSAAMQRALSLARQWAAAPRMGVTNTLKLMRPESTLLNDARLDAEALGIARCNVEGGAFGKGWREKTAGPSISANSQGTEVQLAAQPASSLAEAQRTIAELTAQLSAAKQDLRRETLARAAAEATTTSSQGDGLDSPPVEPLVTPTAASAATAAAADAPKDFGILAMELYTPPYVLQQSDLEESVGVSGKYTKGLLQEEIGFCGPDEDAVSFASNALLGLMEKHNIDYNQIGRLEVGTESMVDRSKSIKTFLMRHFEASGNHNLEGVDTYNACYGGTAALLNSIGWLKNRPPGDNVSRIP
jgi:acyl transferase domain-containing protein/enoyl-CoA hydratase/carnithine racemase/NADPH:quinone reductase-like Zn-dependent oxidoreductase/acyl carrier protein